VIDIIQRRLNNNDKTHLIHTNIPRININEAKLSPHNNFY